MRTLLLAALLYAPLAGAQLVDRVSVIYGQGNSVDVFGVELGTPDFKRWKLGESWSLSAYGMASVAYWHAREHTEHKELYDFGLAPVLRLERARSGGVTPYLEASFGGHLLSRRQINGNREFSTAFQFGEFVGAGFAFGQRQQHSLGLRLQHISNGGIKNPNPGLTFSSVVFQYRF
jgi:hypothetical protein